MTKFFYNSFVQAMHGDPLDAVAPAAVAKASNASIARKCRAAIRKSKTPEDSPPTDEQSTATSTSIDVSWLG